MKGRLENELRIKKRTQDILKDLPDCVSDFYYKMQISSEATTCYEYVKKIRSFMEFAGTDMTKVTTRKIGEYFEKINYLDDGKGGIKASSFSYRKMVWTVLNRFFDFLVKTKQIDFNPMEGTSRPKNNDLIERKFLTMKDLNKILQCAKNTCRTKDEKRYNDRDVLMLYLFMNTGMRNTALSEINIEDIDYNNKRIVVTDKRNKTQIYPLTEQLERLIANWLEVRKDFATDNNALFINKKGNRINSTDIRLRVEKYSKQALGYSVSPHKLRAAFVSLNYEASGHDIEATRIAVGHQSVITTSRYIVQKDDARENATSFMADNLKV